MDDDLRDLLAACHDAGDPSPERERALLARLDADPEFRQLVARELHTLGQLRAVQSGEPRWLRLADALGCPPSPSPADDALADAVVRHGVRRRRRRTGRTAGVAVAAGLIGLAAAGLWRPWAGGPAAGPPLAVVTHRTGVVPAAGGAAYAVGDGLAAGRVGLAAGRLVLRFASGVELGVEGRAEVDLLGPDVVFARSGKVRVRVPAGAEGFTVRGAGYEVVDLGTEFGLTAVAGSNGLLRVFEGRAAVSVQGGGDRPVQSRLVEAGQTVEVDPVALSIRDATPPATWFATLPERPVPENTPLDLAADYPTQVRAAGPWGYWRFQSEDKGAVPNEVPGRPALRLWGTAALSAPAANRAVVFRRGEIVQAVVLDGLWTPPRAGGYAVELWVQATPARPAFRGGTTLLALIADRPPPDDGHVGLLELVGQQADVTAPCCVRLLDRWPPGAHGGTNLFTGRRFAMGAWHHLVGQRTPAGAEVYLDGELIGSSPTRPDDPAVTCGCRVMVGRLKEVPTEPGELRPFDGQLDEVALYDRPLDPDEIRRHADGRRPAD